MPRVGGEWPTLTLTFTRQRDASAVSKGSEPPFWKPTQHVRKHGIPLEWPKRAGEAGPKRLSLV